MKPLSLFILTSLILSCNNRNHGNTLVTDIESTGVNNNVNAAPVFYEVKNYQLFLTAEKNGQHITELLVAKADFDDTMIYIVFAGDIDGDGLLDLIINTSRHYNAATPTLYLSKPAGNTKLLKIMGMHFFVGC